jgi:hypothetical protein
MYSVFICLSLALVLVPFSARAAEPTSAQEIMDCVGRNIPTADTVESIRLDRKGRVGGERSSQLEVYGRTSREGRRHLLLRVSAPPELAGITYLVREKSDGIQVILSTPDFPDGRRLIGAEVGRRLFGTDFSLEDIQRLRGVAPRETSTRLDDDSVDERPTFVIESIPHDDAGSWYRKVVSFVDRATCLIVKSEFYGEGLRLQKVLLADPEHFLSQDGIWLARQLLIRDVRDRTQTRLTVSSIEVGAALPDRFFELPVREGAALEAE